MKHARLAATVAAGVVIVAACGGSSAVTVTPSPAATPSPKIVIGRDAPLTIAVSAALTGDQSSLGIDIADAAEMAVQDLGGSIKGHTIKVERMDDGCTDAEKAVGVARTLIEDSTLVGVIGPMCTTGAQAADGVYDDAHVVHILASATRSDLSSRNERFFFRTAWRDDDQARAQAMYAAAGLKTTTAVVIDDGEPYGKALADAFGSEFEKLSGQVISRERVERGTVDFSSLARQVQSAGPNLVVFEGLNPEGVLLVKALHDAGYSGTFMAPDGVLSVRDFLMSGGAATDGAILTGGAQPDDAFVARFHDRFQRAPTTPFVLQSHDAVGALMQAVASVAVEGQDGTLVIDRERLAETLRSQKYQGLTGLITFRMDGDRAGDTTADFGVTIYRVQDGRFEPVQ